MSRVVLAVVVLIFTSTLAHAQDTFSIVAVDTVTGEIGSAGASCVGPINGVGAYIISDVVEGVGAIHTQASWLSSNQQTAHQQMLLGKSPQEIIDWMATH
ncbi:MAG: secretion protein, partial [Bacteroidetes bacterium]|nr:secretion protein [Bacteroidota bacterium]